MSKNDKCDNDDSVKNDDDNDNNKHCHNIIIMTIIGIAIAIYNCANHEHIYKYL